MKTFCIQTLGCKVNHYESEQIAAVLRSHGLVESEASHADLRVVNTCSVTVEAAAKSRQSTRRLVRLPLLDDAGTYSQRGAAVVPVTQPVTSGVDVERPSATSAPWPDGGAGGLGGSGRSRVIVTGCWATSDRDAAATLGGVDAVITHHADVAGELNRLLQLWREEHLAGGQTDAGQHGLRSRPLRRPQRHASAADLPIESVKPLVESPPEGMGNNDGWISEAGHPAGSRTTESKAESPEKVNLQIYALSVVPETENSAGDEKNISPPVGTRGLPLLDQHQSGRQRAFLKIQDGCDARCTYCIIPRLRPALWSKPTDDAVEEARRLVASGHVEVVLTGVFLSAFGRATALRRRRVADSRDPLADLVSALCTRVPGLRRLRLSSLEPGDLTDELLNALRDHPQVVPHFHLPLQSGSDLILRRMNRQYTRDDFLRMTDRVRQAFDRPALTTDVIAGFPGETDEAFDETVEVIRHAGFIHVHAFPFSPRPGTAAARWTRQAVAGPVVNDRIARLRRLGEEHDYAFRRWFIGEAVELLVERDTAAGPASGRAHGRCGRYFDVSFEAPDLQPGDFATVRIDGVTPRRTYGVLLSVERPTRGGA